MMLSIASEFTRTPGPRSENEGPFSGDAFLKRLLFPKFEEAVKRGEQLVVDLDGTAGYATSFLEAAFGGLARMKGASEVERVLDFRSEDEPFLIEEIKGYIRDVGKQAGARA